MTPVPDWAQTMIFALIAFVAMMGGTLLWRDYSLEGAFGIAATAAVLVVVFELVWRRVRAGS